MRFLAPLSALAFFNIKLIAAIRNSYKQYRNMPGDSVTRNHQRSQEVARYSLTLVVVVVVFLICATPDYVLHIWIALNSFLPNDIPFPKSKLKYVNAISNLFLAINSCTNFVIYCFMGSRFRRILLEMLGKKRPERVPQQLPSTFRFSSQWDRHGEELTILVPVSSQTA